MSNQDRKERMHPHGGVIESTAKYGLRQIRNNLKEKGSNASPKMDQKVKIFLQKKECKKEREKNLKISFLLFNAFTLDLMDFVK